jgi:hypothetical protein
MNHAYRPAIERPESRLPADNASIGPDGIEAFALTGADGTALTGEGIYIGQSSRVEAPIR